MKREVRYRLYDGAREIHGDSSLKFVGETDGVDGYTMPSVDGPVLKPGFRIVFTVEFTNPCPTTPGLELFKKVSKLTYVELDADWKSLTAAERDVWEKMASQDAFR